MTTENTSAETEEQRIGRRRFIKRAAAATAVGVAAAGSVTYAVTRGGGAGTLVCAFRAGTLPVDDPTSKIWRDRAPFIANTLPQNLIAPMAQKNQVPELRVRALHNSELIAFHLEWRDTAVDELEGIARFRDAVAVMLAAKTDSTPAVTMGDANNTVHILQWKASWQSDIDSGRKGVKNLFPNAYNDVLPETLMPVEQAKTFYPGWIKGNTLSQRERTSPVEELVARGFGSLTPHDKQQASGRGVHRSGRWSVVIALPMSSGDPTKAEVKAGETRKVAFAVWNGGEHQRGARKQYADWTTIEVQAPA